MDSSTTLSSSSSSSPQPPLLPPSTTQLANNAGTALMLPKLNRFEASLVDTSLDDTPTATTNSFVDSGVGPAFKRLRTNENRAVAVTIPIDSSGDQVTAAISVVRNPHTTDNEKQEKIVPIPLISPDDGTVAAVSSLMLQIGDGIATGGVTGTGVATVDDASDIVNQIGLLPDDDDVDDDDDDDEDDSIRSSLSDLSLNSWAQEEAGDSNSAFNWIRKQLTMGIPARNLLANFIGQPVPDYLDDESVIKMLMETIEQPRQRQKLDHINTIANVVDLLRESSKIVVLTGAGVSVSCGIPDFRSKDGVYERLAVDFPDLPDPQSMFDIDYFMQDPRPFFKFAKEIYPGNFRPSPCHRFIRLLETKGKLLRNFTQNIDTLESVAGIENRIECHGSFATATCTKCGFRVHCDSIRDDVFAQRIPMCPRCAHEREQQQNINNAAAGAAAAAATAPVTPPVFFNGNVIGPIPQHQPDSACTQSVAVSDLFSMGIMKPDIVFFGEALPELFHETMARDKMKCDLLIVIGSSLKVKPVALIPSSLPPHVPQILINREPLPYLNFDVELLGDCDIIIDQLCKMLDESWQSCIWSERQLTETQSLLPPQLTTAVVEAAAAEVAAAVEEAAAVAAAAAAAANQKQADDLSPQTNCDRVDGTAAAAAAITTTTTTTTATTTSAAPVETGANKTTEASTEIVNLLTNAIIENNESETEAVSAAETTAATETPSQQSQYTEMLSSYLVPDTYYYQPPNRYVFKGAEVYYLSPLSTSLTDFDCDDDDEDDDEDDDDDDEDDDADAVAVAVVDNDDDDNKAIARHHTPLSPPLPPPPPSPSTNDVNRTDSSPSPSPPSSSFVLGTGADHLFADNDYLNDLMYERQPASESSELLPPSMSSSLSPSPSPQSSPSSNFHSKL